MKQIDNVYFQTSLREFLRKKSHNYIVFSVTFEELGILEHRTVAEMILILNGFLAKVELKHIDLSVFLCYHDKKYIFITKEFGYMKKAFCVDIPYSQWNHYEHFIADINNTVSENGTVILAVSNIPYFLKCKLIIECIDGEENTIKDII